MMSGLFETMLIIDGEPQDLDAHIARMSASAKALGFPPVDAHSFADTARNASEGVQGEMAMRVVYAGDEWQLSATIFPIPAATIARREHGRVITLDRSYIRSLPQHKLTSPYAICTLALKMAIEAGADEALFVDASGAVLEGTATNVFAVRENTLITAPVASGILPGITRAKVLEAASQKGMTIEERCPTIAELLTGSFLTGSLTGVVPIRSVNGSNAISYNP